VNAGNDAQRGELGLLGAGKHPDRHVDDALGLGNKVRTVLRFARRRRSDGLDPGHAHLVDQRAKSSKRPERASHGFGAKPPGGGERAAKTA
jgi:hypothetical protein